MIPEQRRAEILSLALEEHSLSVDDFAKRLGVSKETIRRDLRRLDQSGQLRRVHGGALAPQTAHEGDVVERTVQNATLKARIACVAASLFAPNDTLMIDAGTTTLAFAKELGNFPHLGVITNSVEIANVLVAGSAHNPVCLVGGSYRGDRLEMTGAFAIENINRFSVDHAILTIGAIDLDSGTANDFDVEEAMVARAMIKRANAVTILADSTKFNRKAMATVCDLENVNRIVCDDLLDVRSRKEIKSKGIELILV